MSAQYRLLSGADGAGFAPLPSCPLGSASGASARTKEPRRGPGVCVLCGTRDPVSKASEAGTAQGTSIIRSTPINLSPSVRASVSPAAAEFPPRESVARAGSGPFSSGVMLISPGALGRGVRTGRGAWRAPDVGSGLRAEKRVLTSANCQAGAPESAEMLGNTPPSAEPGLVSWRKVCQGPHPASPLVHLLVGSRKRNNGKPGHSGRLVF